MAPTYLLFKKYWLYILKFGLDLNKLYKKWYFFHICIFLCIIHFYIKSGKINLPLLFKNIFIIIKFLLINMGK